MSSDNILTGVAAVRTIIDFLVEVIQAVTPGATGASLDNIQDAVLQHILADSLRGLAGVEPPQSTLN